MMDPRGLTDAQREVDDVFVEKVPVQSARKSGDWTIHKTFFSRSKNSVIITHADLEANFFVGRPQKLWLRGN